MVQAVADREWEVKFEVVEGGTTESLDETVYNIQEAEYAVTLFMDKFSADTRLLAPSLTQRNLMREIMKGKKTMKNSDEFILTLEEYEGAGFDSDH